MKIRNKIIYKIGRHSKKFRIWYWKHSGNRWFWGWLQFVEDIASKSDIENWTEIFKIPMKNMYT